MWDHHDTHKFIPEFKSGKPDLESYDLKRQPINGVIRKIHLYYLTAGTGVLAGFRFFDRDDVCIYESADKRPFNKPYF